MRKQPSESLYRWSMMNRRPFCRRVVSRNAILTCALQVDSPKNEPILLRQTMLGPFPTHAIDPKTTRRMGFFRAENSSGPPRNVGFEMLGGSHYYMKLVLHVCIGMLQSRQSAAGIFCLHYLIITTSQRRTSPSAV